MQKSQREGLVSTTVLCKYLDLSLNRVQELAKEGVIPHTKTPNGKYLRYDLMEAVKAYIHHLRDRPEDKKGSLSQRKLQAEVDFREAKAREAELRLAEFEGTMHRSEDVEACTDQLVRTVRAAFLGIPGRVAVDCAAVDTAAEVAAIVKRETDRALGELSNFEYDPKVYARMVREREGLRSDDDE